MESLTPSAIAALTLVLSNALEETGESLGEQVMEQASKVIERLKHRAKEIARSLEQARQNPELVIEEPEEYGVAVLVEKVEAEAKTDSELRASIEALAKKVEDVAKLDVEMAAALDALTETLKAQRPKFNKTTKDNNNGSASMGVSISIEKFT